MKTSPEETKPAKKKVRKRKRAPAPPWEIGPLLSPNSLRVLERRYLKKDAKGHPIEKPSDMFWRVALNIAQVEKKYNPDSDTLQLAREFYDLMGNLEFLPNSPTLMNAGRELQQLSACFVLPVEDSMDSIFEAIKNTALIHKSGGGTGFSFSRIRPKNDVVKTTQGISSGPISFMTVFDAATETVKQGGTRRGANMGILRIDHPDILDFITAKEDTGRLNNFNLSVGLTEGFMKAVESDSDYPLINPRTRKEVKRLDARTVFKKIVESAWNSGEPGIVFLDRLNKGNPTPSMGMIESTNPCGEQPLLPYESCNLGSINLSKMVRYQDGKTSIDYPHLTKVIKLAVRFLDDVIDANRFPLPEIKTATLANRKIGLGLMGFADMLIKLSIPYDSDRALQVAEKVMEYINNESKKVSHELAEERGAFPTFEESIWVNTPWGKLRNATTTTIAPTGTLSIIANCSSGIEPLYAVSYIRQHILDDEKMVEVNPIFLEVAKKEDFYSEEIIQEIGKRSSLKEVPGVPEHIKRLFVTAYDISPEWHIKMQAAFQRHVDNAVSKTVNFPRAATPQDIEKAYLLAYKEECKGVTVYREGSREGVLITEKPEEEQKPQKGKITPRPRPYQTRGTTQKIGTGCGNLYITINEDDQGPNEIFALMGKSGGCPASQAEATGRLVSLALRSGVDIDAIIEQLRGIRCPSPLWSDGNIILSCSDAIAKALEQYHQAITGKSSPRMVPGKKNFSGICPECPECGSLLEFGEGCVTCRHCGYTRCS